MFFSLRIVKQSIIHTHLYNYSSSMYAFMISTCDLLIIHINTLSHHLASYIMSIMSNNIT